MKGPTDDNLRFSSGVEASSSKFKWVSVKETRIGSTLPSAGALSPDFSTES